MAEAEVPDRTESESPPDPPTPRWVTAADVALEGLAIAFLVVAAAGWTVHSSRGNLAQRFAENWLAEHGVEGAVQVTRIDATGFSGRLRLGPKNDPDLIADRVDVDYAFTPPWAGGRFDVRARSIRLMHPRAKLAFDGKQLRFGSLDPLVRELLARPKSDQPAPDIRIDDGELRLTTPYGLVRIQNAQANLSEARLRRLTARLAPADLKAGEARLDLAGGDIHASGDGEMIQAVADLSVTSASVGRTVALDNGTLSFSLSNLTYDLDHGLSVNATGHADGQAASFVAGPAKLAKSRFDLAFPRLQARFGETTTGTFSAEGTVGADSLTGSVSARALTAHLRMSSAEWTSGPGGARLHSPVTLTGAATDLPLSIDGRRVVLSGAKAEFAGRVDTAAATRVIGVASIGAGGGLSGRDAGHLAASVPVLGQEPQYAAALEAALRRFTLSAPSVDVGLGDGGLALTPQRPLTITAASGARVIVTPTRLAVRDQGAAGALTLTAQGGGLPPISMTAEGMTFRKGEFDARARLQTTLDFGPARDLTINAGGRARYGKAGFSFVASDCADISAAKLELGENDVEGIAGQACPLSGAPLVTADPRGWRLSGRFQDGKASAPFLEAKVEDASGRFTVSGTSGGTIGADIALGDSRAIDTAKSRRFEPVHASGPLQLAADVWRGNLLISGPGLSQLGHVALTQDMNSGAGWADIDADPVFARNGLRLGDITPLIDVVDDLEGPVAFRGRVGWSKDTPANGTGRLTINGLSLTSLIGPVKGVSGVVELTSLFPLTTAPDQTIRAELIDGLLPMQQAVATFDLSDEALHLRSAQVRAVSGQFRLEPMTIPLTADPAFSGAVQFTGVDIGQVIALTSYAEKIKARLIVDGRIPFEVDKEGVRIPKGEFATTEPGRVSISRTVLTRVETGNAVVETPAGEAPAVNAVQDMVYQAMENLAVDSLSAKMESLPSGRLATVFRIKGRHDPAVAEQPKLSIFDLLRGQAFNKRVPLPKGTPIDMTLDTSLNFSELVKGMQSSFETFRELHLGSRSDPVQR